MNNAIEVENLTKFYDKFLAVDHITFTVKQDEIFGFLGPNGAGKTTTQRMLTTLLTPTEGRILINGHDLRAVGGDGRLGAGAGLRFAAALRPGPDEPRRAGHGLPESVAGSGPVAGAADRLPDPGRQIHHRSRVLGY